MIVEDDTRGTSQATYAELADRTSRFAQLLRNLGHRRRGSRPDPAAELARLPDRLPRHHEARRDQRPDLDPAHRGGGAVPRQGLPGSRNRHRQGGLAELRAAARGEPDAEVRPAHRRGARRPGARPRGAGARPGARRHHDLGRTAPDAPRRPCVPRLHVGHDRLSEGRAARPPLPARPAAGLRVLVRFRGRWRPHPALGQVQLDLRARLGDDGPALPRRNRDRARGQERRHDLAASHREARRDDLHRCADRLPPDHSEDGPRGSATCPRCVTA